MIILFSGCAGTKNHKSIPPLKVSGKSSTTAQQAFVKLFGERPCPFNIALRKSDKTPRNYTEASDGIKARGLGGFALPLILEVKGIDVIERERIKSGYRLTINLDATVNGIPPKCGKVKGYVKLNEDDTASLEFTNFYCNWVLIGNVFVNMKLAFDIIDLESEVFSGYYSLTFKGTGNAAGSGYFAAQVTGE